MVEEKNLNLLKQLVFDAFMESAPYLQNLEWIKNVCFKCLDRVEKPEQLKSLLEEEVKKEEDRFKKVDLKIFMAYFFREWRKRFGYKP
ncbi:MAG: hypothetical protein DRO36_00865 [Candidatus Hecatellales archaeon]|nr:MAG: hypothetical protein DRO36_00865 [Candidatus Hecatellales archaeon]